MSMTLPASSPNILYIGFNQDYGCFACGTTNGFRIYNTDPFKETFQRDFNNCGIGYVEMLFRCNILALIGGGRSPQFHLNKVMIWDDHQNRCIGELSFRSEVKAVKLRRDRVVVVLEYKIYVYNFSDLKLLHQIETSYNPKGLCALCPYSNNNVLVCPSLTKGSIRVELYDQKKTTWIEAHESAISCMCLNYDGTRLATSSETGTLIRIFDTNTGATLQELRRGADRAEIYSIAFHPTSAWLAVSSDKGTIHIFALQKTKDSNESTSSSSTSSSSSSSSSSNSTAVSRSNPTSSFSFLKNYLPKYFSSEW